MIDITFGNQWRQFFGGYKWNWVIINLLNIEIENEKFLGSFYIEICLVGFYIRISWLYNDNTPARNKINNYVKKNERILKRSSK